MSKPHATVSQAFIATVDHAVPTTIAEARRVLAWYNQLSETDGAQLAAAAASPRFQAAMNILANRVNEIRTESDAAISRMDNYPRLKRAADRYIAWRRR